MLQRFRTLFNLPSAIRGSISKGEYDLAVREYRKAKSIVLPSHVQIFPSSNISGHDFVEDVLTHCILALPVEHLPILCASLFRPFIVNLCSFHIPVFCCR